MANRVIKPDLEDWVQHGSKYDDLKSEIFTSLPDDPLDKGRTILKRMREKILNVKFLTAAEREARSKSDQKAPIHSRNLDETSTRRWTDSSGIYYLAFQLLRDAKLFPKVVLVADRDQRAFRYDFCDYYQLDRWLIALSDADGKNLWLAEPNVRFLPLGVIDSDYQGTNALLVDSKDWSARSFQVPFQSPDLNRKIYTFDIFPGEEENHFKIHSTSQGLEAWFERSSTYSLRKDESEKHLKDQLQGAKSIIISRVSVPDWAQPSDSFDWEAEGTFEIESGRHKSVNPFPTTVCPLWLPGSWPQKRVDPVVMHYPSDNESTSRIHVPEGWKAADLPPTMERSNRFGTLVWRVQELQESGATLIQVTFNLRVSNTIGDATSEKDLRDLLSSVQEAWSRVITLEKCR